MRIVLCQGQVHPAEAVSIESRAKVGRLRSPWIIVRPEPILNVTLQLSPAKGPSGTPLS